MTDMKRYGCNRLYLAENDFRSTSVVSIGHDGKVNHISPLTEETSATEWVGGVIVLSDKEELTVHQDFRTLLREMTRANQPTYAWHISPFDFPREELTPQSIIRRL